MLQLLPSGNQLNMNLNNINKDFVIAHTVFGTDGVVVDIKLRYTPTTFMDCNYWSCYVHEDERLLLGGLEALQFATIRNIAQSENYTQFVKVLNLLDQIIKGVGVGAIPPSFDDVTRLREMINVETAGNHDKNFIPVYVQTLFHHLLMNKKEITINLRTWAKHLIFYNKESGHNVYGYKRFGELFGFEATTKMIDINFFIKLFRNVAVFTIGDFGIGHIAPSVSLSYDFVEKVFECIEYVNESPSVLSLHRIEILKPSSSINEFIESMGNEFEVNGWELRNATFVGKGLHSSLGSAEMLLIEKLKN